MRSFIRFIVRAYNLYFSSNKQVTGQIRSIIGFTPANLSLFILAFSHKSSNSEEKAYAVQNNERLEYLGDAILGTVVAEFLFKKYPDRDEGFLTKMRSKIVKRKTLNEIGESMELGLLLADLNNTKLSSSMYGNAVEALVGAVYLEKGYVKTKRFIIKQILQKHLNIHRLETLDENYKSQLLEWCQKNNHSINYKLLKRYKHKKRDRFEVAVLIDGQQRGTADDYNKKSAEQKASMKALKSLNLLTTEQVA